MKMRDFMNDQEITVLEEKEVSPNSEAKQTRPIPKYLNPPKVAPENMLKRRPINILPSQQSPLDPRNTRQPQKIWDKNSGFTYTGMFSSDCWWNVINETVIE